MATTGNLSSLTDLDLSRNKLNNIPFIIARLRELQRLDLTRAFAFDISHSIELIALKKSSVFIGERMNELWNSLGLLPF